MTIQDIKDRTPNANLIKVLKALLKQAKNGDIRSLVAVSLWDDNATSQSWALDDRSDMNILLAELTLAQHEFMVNIGLLHNDSVLSRALDELEKR